MAGVKFLIRDRAGQFISSFDAVFTTEGIRILLSPPQAPGANAICERMIGTLRREVLDRLLIVNEHHLRWVLTEYLRQPQHGPAAPFPRPANPSSSRHLSTQTGQPRRAQDPPQAGYSGDLPASTTSQPCHPALLRKTQVNTPKRISEPHRLRDR